MPRLGHTPREVLASVYKPTSTHPPLDRHHPVRGHGAVDKRGTSAREGASHKWMAMDVMSACAYTLTESKPKRGMRITQMCSAGTEASTPPLPPPPTSRTSVFASTSPGPRTQNEEKKRGRKEGRYWTLNGASRITCEEEHSFARIGRGGAAVWRRSMFWFLEREERELGRGKRKRVGRENGKGGERRWRVMRERAAEVSCARAKESIDQLEARRNGFAQVDGRKEVIDSTHTYAAISASRPVWGAMDDSCIPQRMIDGARRASASEGAETESAIARRVVALAPVYVSLGGTCLRSSALGNAAARRSVAELPMLEGHKRPGRRFERGREVKLHKSKCMQGRRLTRTSDFHKQVMAGPLKNLHMYSCRDGDVVEPGLLPRRVFELAATQSLQYHFHDFQDRRAAVHFGRQARCQTPANNQK
ncbi:hypothetical protein B0H19DRAFT_1237086 [Mycena capillaripes]|nr:hypothetical protein B0H19DRAFT_1237086 [Mycena capillaripes]